MELWPYLQSLWEYWWALMSCAAFTLLGTVVLVFRKSERWAIWATFSMAFAMLLLASFLAWKDQYKENQAARQVGSLSLNGLNVPLLENKNQKDGQVQVGIVLDNVRDRVIEYRVDKFDLQVDGKTSSIQALNYGGYVYPLRSNTYRGSQIPVEDTRKSPMTGTLDYVITYNTLGTR